MGDESYAHSKQKVCRTCTFVKGKASSVSGVHRPARLVLLSPVPSYQALQSQNGQGVPVCSNYPKRTNFLVRLVLSCAACSIRHAREGQAPCRAAVRAAAWIGLGRPLVQFNENRPDSEKTFPRESQQSDPHRRTHAAAGQHADVE